MRVLLVLSLLVGCPAPTPPPVVAPPVEPPPPVAEPEPAPPPIVKRTDIAVGESPMSLVVWRDHLLWTDAAGAIWSLPTAGGTPTQLSDQKTPDFAFKLIVAGDAVFATSRKDLLRVDSPSGPVRKAGITGIADNALDIAATSDVYVTIFKRDEIMRIPVAGGRASKIAAHPRGILALTADALYIASYSTGAIIALPMGAARTKPIAKGFVRPTALAADESRLFVYSEKQEALYRVLVATGETTKIADGVVNSDELVSDGAWLYTRTWAPRGQLLRVSKDGGQAPEVLADDLKSPYAIAFDDEAIYATVRDQNKIVRIAKAAL